MYKRLNAIPLFQLQQQTHPNAKKPHTVIDISTPALKLQPHFPTPRHRTPFSNKLRKLVTRPNVEEQQEKCSAPQYESKTAETLQIPIQEEQDGEGFVFKLRKYDGKRLAKLLDEERYDEVQGKIKYKAHPDDKMHERIQQVQIDFRPMTVEDSIKLAKNDRQAHNSANNLNKYIPPPKHYKTYPMVFANSDHKRGLFALQVNRPQSRTYIQNQHRMHDNAVSKALEKLSQEDTSGQHAILVPKPTTKYCFVCRGHYDDYLGHITSELHLENDKKAKIWVSIKETCKKFQASLYLDRFKRLEGKFEEKEKEKRMDKLTSREIQQKIKEERRQSANLQQKKRKPRQYYKEKKLKQTSKPYQSHKVHKSQPKAEREEKDEHRKSTKSQSSKHLKSQSPRPSSTLQQQKPAKLQKDQHKDNHQEQLSKDQHSNSSSQKTIVKAKSKSENIQTPDTKRNDIKGNRMQKLIIEENRDEQKTATLNSAQSSPDQQNEKNGENIQSQQKGQKQEKTPTQAKLPQKKVSIMHSEYPKLVPPGQTYKKPKKPATVSLCLTGDIPTKQSVKQKPKTKENQVKQKKSSHYQKSATEVFKQQSIDKFLNNKKTTQKEQLSSRHKKIKIQKEQTITQKIIEERTSQKRHSSRKIKLQVTSSSLQREKQKKRAKSADESASQAVSNQQPKMTFVGLAKTRSRQKQINVTKPT